MQTTTERFTTLAALVRGLEGCDTAELGGAGLFAAQADLAALIVEAKRMYAPYAARIADLSTPGSGNFAKAHGFGTPEKLIAAALGGTISEARTLIEAGRALEDAGDDPDEPEHPDGEGDPDGDAESGGSPDAENNEQNDPPAPPPPRRTPQTPVARALAAGRITADAAAVIRATLRSLQADTPALKDRLRGLEIQLVGKAERVSLSDLRTACERAAGFFDVARAQERARRLREARGVFFTPQPDGSVRISGQLDPDTAAGLMAFCSAYTTHAFRAARDLDVPERRTAAQMRADALAVMAEHIIACDHPATGVKATIIVQVSLEDLERRSGTALNHTTRTTAAASALRRHCADAEVIPAVMGSRSAPLDVGRGDRLCTPEQRLALIARDQGCVWCDAPPTWCDAHHLTHWADGGPTDLENLALLCRSCHTTIHSTRWRVMRRDDDTWIIPPPEVDPAQTPIPSARARQGHGGGASPVSPESRAAGERNDHALF